MQSARSSLPCAHKTIPVSMLPWQGAVEARNANYAAIVRNLQFTKRAWFGLRLAEELDEGRPQRFADSDSDSSANEEEEHDKVEQVQVFASIAMLAHL